MLIAEYILIWVLFGIATTIAAGEGGRKMGVWLCWGLMFSVFALAFVLILNAISKSGRKA